MGFSMGFCFSTGLGFSGFGFSTGFGFAGIALGGKTGLTLGDLCLIGALSCKLGTLTGGFDEKTSFGTTTSLGATLAGFRFLGPRARPLVRCVNSLPSAFSTGSTIPIGAGAD
jgi:hypothetical protein